MDHNKMSDWDKYIQEHRFHKRWRRAITVLCTVVLFFTVYALTLPAITMEKECSIPEHIHEEACFTQVVSVTKQVPICTGDTLGIHQHEAGCYDLNGNPVCGYADFVVHQHDAACYDEDGELWCTLREVAEHPHLDSCFLWPQFHIHEDSCYTKRQGKLVCETHVHTDSCWSENVTNICGQEESDSHVHEDLCWECTKELTCGVESDHVHTENCYEILEEQTCGQEEPPADAPAEPELICTRMEIVPHCHAEDCYDGANHLLCGKMQILRHQHGDACFTQEEIPVDTENLTCTIPEGDGSHTHGEACYDENGILTCHTAENSGHRHSPLCYGTWKRICQQQEHTHTESCQSAAESDGTEETTETDLKETVLQPEIPLMFMAGSVNETEETRDTQEEENGTDPTEASMNSVDVSGYVSNAELQYQTGDNAEWKNVINAENIPGDATFQLKVFYTGVPIDALLNAGCRMSYSLPAVFREAAADGKIEDSAQQEIGTITASGNGVIIEFDQQWLKNQKTETNTVIDGDFYVKAKANLSQIPQDGQTTITFGNVTITIDFADDVIAQYGNVEIQKTVQSRVEETDTGDYLQYTLTVTAGADGCPDVSVEDLFTTGADFIARGADSHIVVTGVSPENAALAMVEEKMTWTIGNMQPNEVRTLSYKVKLAEGYAGDVAKGNIQNSAKVLSGTYERDTDTVTFEPNAKGTLSKIGTNITTNSDGSSTITYYIWVKALPENSYTLDNVKIIDSLDGLGKQNTKATDPKIRKHLLYNLDSFRLYAGGTQGQHNLDNLVETTGGNLEWGADSNNDNQHNDSFTYYVGPLAPGESKTLVYTLTVQPGAYIAAGNGSFTVDNRAEIKTAGENTQNHDQWLNGVLEEVSFSRKAWSRKLASPQPTQEQTAVTMSGDVYNTNGTTHTNPGSFSIPAGSYRYRVVANEAGDWNLSAATLRDTLGANMQFVGYVQVDAYHVEADAPASSLEDQAVVDYFTEKTPCKTFWIHVDGTSSFQVTPGTMDGGDANHAYLLTYYAKPVNTEGITQVPVGNTFTIQGTVGIGNNTYVITGISTSAEVTVSGSNSFQAEKRFWYYENPQVTTGDFSKGALYWVIRVDGNLIPANTWIRDITNQSGGTTHYIRSSSLAGIYTGNLGEEWITAYQNMAAMSSGGNLTPLAESFYTVVKTNEMLTLKLNQDLQLDSDHALYIVVKTEPGSLPQNDRDAFEYCNKLQSSSDNSNWLNHGVARKTLYGSVCIFKELGRVFTYSGTGNTIQQIQQGHGSDIVTAELDGAGTYVAWQIHLNYEGTLDGTYRVLEQIPAGMKVAYIRTYWLGDEALKQENGLPTSAQISGLDDSWKPNTKTLGSRNSRNYTTYYYINGQQVMMEYQNLAPGGIRDKYAVEIQVVCKLTDPDVLLGGAEKTFNNTVRLFSADGKEIGSDSHGVTLSAPKLTKSKDNTVTVSGGSYPFVITLNELGTDLLPNGNTITLVDELGENLIINTASIAVKNTKTGAELTQGWKSSVENDGDGTQTLRLDLPDNQPLTVTYTVSVNAPPGQKVTVTNNARWEGYATTDSSSVQDTEFQYEVGGTAGGAATPQITVHKIDQYNNQLSLSGAVFTLTEMQLQDGNLVEKAEGMSQTETTGEDGNLTFGKEAALLKFNTVYRIQETKAPAGYVLDPQPHYVLVAQKETSSGKYPDFTEQRNAGVYIHYSGSTYTYEAKNYKGEILVDKIFQNAEGSTVGSLDGTYSFGLYTDKAGTQKRQETYVTFVNGEKTVSAKFINVDLDTPYYIYELNDQGDPIKSGAGTVSGIPFVVSYSAESVTVTADSPSCTVTVTNRTNYAELPLTGGMGTTPYAATGILLMAAALCLLYIRRKEERGILKS